MRTAKRMRRVVCANVGPEARQQIEALAVRWKLSVSDTARRLCVLGTGGTTAEARALNGEIARWRKVFHALARERHPGVQLDKPRSTRPDHGRVAIRLPSALRTRVETQGGFKAALLRGLKVA